MRFDVWSRKQTGTTRTGKPVAARVCVSCSSTRAWLFKHLALISPGHAAWEYFGYGRRQYARIRELEPVIARAAADDFDRAGLGLRLRYLSGGMSDEARTIDRYVMPERSGYYLGARMTDAAFSTRGADWAVRASAAEISAIAEAAAATA